MQLAEIVETSSRVAATSARNEKVEVLSASVARLDDESLHTGVSFLAGVVPQGSIGIGYASLRDPPPPAESPSLSLGDVHAALDEIAATSGSGSVSARKAVIDGLFARATGDEAEFLAALLAGGLRQGANESLVADAVAKANRIPKTVVRRAVMFTGDVGEVALIARTGGRDEVEAAGLRLYRPVLPMLASTAPSVAGAIEKLGEVILERKLDGARIQVHHGPEGVRVFTRNLNDVTERLPEVVAAVERLEVEEVVLDGEAIALDPTERPLPFQVTMARFGSEDPGATLLTPFFFDILHCDGIDVFELPTTERLEILDRVVPDVMRVPRVVTADVSEAELFFADTIESGHEGVMAKSLDSPYQAGRRGKGWLKVKPVHTLDLVVLAVEWGSGRRRGWLSNIHLGARAADGSFVMLGKTFKGMTDAILQWQTDRFLDLETHREGHIVFVRPEQVVEIAFDGIQASSRYPGGMALRFARVKGYREDKSADEADTIESVRAIFERQ